MVSLNFVLLRCFVAPVAWSIDRPFPGTDPAATRSPPAGACSTIESFFMHLAEGRTVLVRSVSAVESVSHVTSYFVWRDWISAGCTTQRWKTTRASRAMLRTPRCGTAKGCLRISVSSHARLAGLTVSRCSLSAVCTRSNQRPALHGSICSVKRFSTPQLSTLHNNVIAWVSELSEPPVVDFNMR